MTPAEAQQIIDALAKGIDPETGEVLPSDSFLNSPHIIRALFFASKALDAAIRKAETNDGRLGKAGKPWSEVEDAQLLKAFDAGATVHDLASTHERSAGGINSRLVRLGRVGPTSPRTLGTFNMALAISEEAPPNGVEKFFVYWVHLYSETEIFTNGYIGVTDNIDRRWRRHKRNTEIIPTKRNTFPLYVAFRKHGIGNFQFDVLARNLDKWSAYNLEYALRPHARIGYNLETGGFWRSCLVCSSLSPKRLSVRGQELITAHIEDVIAYRQKSAPLQPENLVQVQHASATTSIPSA